MHAARWSPMNQLSEETRIWSSSDGSEDWNDSHANSSNQENSSSDDRLLKEVIVLGLFFTQVIKGT